MHDMQMHHMHEMPMTGAYGPYPMTREASGTAWQPDAAPHPGLHLMPGKWMVMVHGFADVAYDDQGGPRGGDPKFYSGNMAMAVAQRPLGPGVLGLRTMLSLEPATIGREGYPLLLQTGETADGVTPLVDRQHPHDLFMELAASYRVSKFFLYGGLPGEPALGPPAFMHRFSGMNLPVAPITHHWLDSSHITYGVLTAGAVFGRVKLEASAFRGREPDQDRWGIEQPKLDSYSWRASWNPGEHWALQASTGRLESPEQLEPEVDQDRSTFSVMYHGNGWETTLAWGRNENSPGHTLDALLGEAAFEIGERHLAMARVESVEKDELFPIPEGDLVLQSGEVFTVGEVTLGYRFDFLREEHASIGLGAAGTFTILPQELYDSYGTFPISGVFFVRASLR